MSIATHDFEVTGDNPLDMIEAMVFGQDWPCERVAEDELAVSVQGNWCDYQISISWREEMATLHLACAFDAGLAKKGLPGSRRSELHALLALINEQLLLGHFDLWQEESAIVFRHGALLHGASTSQENCEALLQIAVDTAERFFPAFQFVIWGGKSAAEAMEASLFETEGEA